MMALFLCAIFAEYMQPGVISQAHTSLFAHDDRTYKNAPNNLLGQMLVSIFRLGTVTMAICVCLCSAEHGSFAAFAAVGGLTFGMLLVKMLCNGLIDYTFMISRRLMPAYEQYGDIVTLATCILFPLLAVVLRFGTPVAGRWILGSTAVLFVLIWTYRMMRNYLRTPMAMMYIALYICTLEVLPMGVLFYLSSITINSL